MADGNHLTREGLAEKLRGAGFAAKGLELAYLIMHLGALPEALAHAVTDGVVLYYSAGAATAQAHAGPGNDVHSEAGPRIDLIQCYDEYIMGYSATRHYMGGGAPAFPFEGQPMHVVLLDGRMAGWLLAAYAASRTV